MSVGRIFERFRVQLDLRGGDVHGRQNLSR